MIVLAREIAGGEAPILPLLDVTVERNAFGRQLDSFEAELAVPVLGDRPVHAVFIRAPIIERTGPDVDVLARLDDGRIVAVRERNVIATAFHPELAGETRFHRLVATMAAEHDDPGEGSGRRPHPTRRREDAIDDATSARPRSPAARSAPARLTDLAALGELSRLCQSDDAATRSLGLPVSGPPIGVFSLFRLPLGAFRPNDLMYVYEEDGPASPAWSASSASRPRRVDDRRARRGRDGRRRRHPLPARPAAPARGRKRGAGALPRRLRRRRRQRRAVHAGRASCATARSAILFRRRTTGRCPTPWTDEAARARRGIRPADAARRARRSPGCTPRRRRSRSRASRRSGSPTGSARATHWRVPRSSLTPILRFADVEGFVQESPGRRQGRHAARRRSSRSASPRRTSRTISRSCPARRRPSPISSTSASGVIAARTEQGGGHRHDHGVIAPVRTYESPIDRRLEDAGFAIDRHRHAADEGNPRPRRRAGPRAGRRPLAAQWRPAWVPRIAAANRSTTSTRC